MSEGSNYNIFHRRDKVHGLIANNEIRQATLQLLDFTRDFAQDKNFETEALMVCADSAEYDAEKRKNIRTPTELTSIKREIILRICGILNEIINTQRNEAEHAA